MGFQPPDMARLGSEKGRGGLRLPGMDPALDGGIERGLPVAGDRTRDGGIPDRGRVDISWCLKMVYGKMIVIMRRRVGISVRVDVRMRVEAVIVWRKGRNTVIIALFCAEYTAVILKGPRLMLRRFRVVNWRRLSFHAGVNQGYSK